MMNNIIKKILAPVLVLTLMLSLTVPAFAAEDKIKIGISIWSSTDTLGSECKRVIDAAAEALGVETVWIEQQFLYEQVTASAEAIAEAGCDGIIICNSTSAEMGPVIRTCEENEIYAAQFFRVIDPELNPGEYALACASPYYVGAVHEDEFENGRTLVTILGEKGCRRIGLEGWEPGDAAFLGRWAGYRAGVEAWNTAHPGDQMTLLDPQYGRGNADTGRATAEAILRADLDIDALIVAGGGEILRGALAGIEGMGLTGKIAVVSTDCLSGLDEMFESGAVTAVSGGHYADPLFAFLLVYNAVRGSFTVLTDGFYELVVPYSFVASPEDYARYQSSGEMHWDAAGIRALAGLDPEALSRACAAPRIADAA